MKFANLLLPGALVISAIILAVGWLSAAGIQQLNAKELKTQAIDGCFTVAKGTDISGSVEKNGWTVEKSNMNNDIYNDCMKKKGY